MHLDQAGPHLGRLQVGHPDPLQPVDRGQLRQQLLQQPQVAEVLAVRGGVLADQQHLLDPVLGEPAGFGQHLGRRPGQVGAAERRDGAEAAPPVAARRELQRRPRTGGQPAPQDARPAGRGDAVGKLGHPVTRCEQRGRRAGTFGRGQREQLASVPWHVRGVGTAGHDRLQPVGHVRVVVEAEHRVGLRQRLSELGAVPLGQAADGHHRLRTAVGLEVRGRQQGVDAVLLGRLDEAAGVHHHRVGVGGVRDQLEPAQLQPRGQLLGVDVVAGATQRDEMDGGVQHSHGRTSMPDRRDGFGLSAGVGGR